MGKEDLIVCFEDTLEKSNYGSLKQRTARSVKSNRVYKEDFISRAKHRGENATIEVYSGSTFDVARRYCSLGKVAVLNFANPENPGGGVQLGAMAQEECLCRSSNLYACISSPNVFDEYYGYHRGIRSHFYTDRLIYTKNVTVFKDDSLVPQMLPENEWFEVDVITCAAPYLARRKHTNGAALFELFKSRIKNIFEAARDNNVDYLILGAFGCGAFKNPPLIVAEAFRRTIEEQNYLNDFKQIVFAIKPTGEDCPNLSIFSRQFDAYAPDADERCVLLPEPLEWRLHRCPALPTESRFSNKGQFSTWQMNNAYFGKQFSILGDSISTLQGFNPKGYKVFYTDDKCIKAGVAEAQDTWWDKVIGFFGGELLVNNSWSGSRVTRLPKSESLFPSGCSDKRTGGLHINEVNPDVIMVYLGTNDWAFGAELDGGTRLLEDELNMCNFAVAYESMLQKLKQNYPQSEIWCCTLTESFMSSNPSFKFPYTYAGTHIEDYNQIIQNTAKMFQCKVIDLYSYHIPYDSIDGTHPNADGMNTLAMLMIREIGGEEINPFLDCENEQHQFSLTYGHDQNWYGGYHVCEKCGKVLREPLPIYKDGVNEKQHCCSQYGNVVNNNDRSYTKCGTTVSYKSETAPSKSIVIGTIIGGKYELLKLIGQGGTFKVFLAMDIRLNRQWAVKILCNDFYDMDYAKHCALQEVTILKSLNHPAIPRIVDIIDLPGCFAIVQEYFEGETLNEIVKKCGAQPVELVMDWANQLCDVLVYLHSLNPPHIHRDIKPNNLILAPTGRIKIIDFGIMRTYKPNQKNDTYSLGTKGYAAPEQYGGRGQSDARTDIYGVGMTLYCLLTGLDPIEENFVVRPLCQVNPALPKGIEYIIDKCIQLNPKDRYQNCAELLNDLNHYTELPKPKGIFGKLFRKR